MCDPLSHQCQSHTSKTPSYAAICPIGWSARTRFYERKEIKDAIAYLRLVHNPDDSLSLQRIINQPPRRIGKTSVTTLVQWAAQLGLSQTEALRVLSGERGQHAIKAKGALLMDNAPFSDAAKTALLGFWRLLAAWIAGKDGLTVGQLLDRILEESGYAPFVRDGTEEGEGRWENLQELRTVAANYADLPIGDGLAAFLEEIALVSDRTSSREPVRADIDDPAHGQRIGVPGCLCRRYGGGYFSSQPQQGRPRPHAGGASPGLRRHHAGQALSLSGARLQTHVVRQLGDVPPQPVPGRYPPAFDRRQGRPRTQRPGPHDRPPVHGGTFHDLEPVTVLDQPAGRNPADPICAAIPAGRRQPQFKPGQRVTHGLFGEGVVIKTELADDDEYVSIAFAGKGVKKLMASLAKLQVVR